MHGSQPITLRYRHLPGEYAVCSLPADATLPGPATGFHCVLLAGGEYTLYCLREHAPATARIESGWALLELDGSFDFTVVGVMAAWTAPLAAAGIAVLALSSFATDYLLLRQTSLQHAHQVLAAAGLQLLD